MLSDRPSPMGNPAMPATPRRVLHVDDNAGDRRLVSMALSALGRRVVLHSAESGEAALDLLGLGKPAAMASSSATSAERISPDVIIVDINMPGMNGFEFVDTLIRHQNFANANILFLSSSRSPADARRAIGLGGSLFAVKPLGYEGLCETLDIALRSFAGEIELPSSGDVPAPGNGEDIIILKS